MLCVTCCVSRVVCHVLCVSRLFCVTCCVSRLFCVTCCVSRVVCHVLCVSRVVCVTCCVSRVVCHVLWTKAKTPKLSGSKWQAQIRHHSMVVFYKNCTQNVLLNQDLKTVMNLSKAKTRQENFLFKDVSTWLWSNSKVSSQGQNLTSLL